MINSFESEYAAQQRVIRSELILPVRTPDDFFTSISFIGDRLISEDFFGNPQVERYVLTALFLANAPEVASSFDRVHKSNRQKAIRGLSLLDIAKQLDDFPNRTFSESYDVEDVVADHERARRAANSLSFYGRDLLLTLAPISEIAKGDKVLIEKRMIY